MGIFSRLFSKNSRTTKWRRALSVAVVIILIVIVGAAFMYVQHRHERVAERLTQAVDEIREQQTQLEQMQGILAQLSQQDSELVDRLDTIQDSRSQTQERIETISSSIQQRQQRTQEQELTNIVRTWNERIARIECSYRTADGARDTATASGVATQVGGGLVFITNRHLVQQQGRTLQECNVSMPQHEIDSASIPAENILASKERDIAYLNPPGGTISVPLTTSLSACSAEPEIGDRVVTLGFPRVGSQDSTTVTDGIISGFEEDFYITSAKIERGNSGGAAILVKNNCFLGLPTLVVVGRIESLARILPVNSLTQLEP